MLSLFVIGLLWALAMKHALPGDVIPAHSLVTA